MSRDVDPTDPSPSPPPGPTGAAQYEWDHSEQPTVAVVEAVAAATGRDPKAMPPLYHAVDADALDAILRAGADGTRGSVHVSFQYAGTDVTVAADGTVSVRRRTVEDG